MAKSRYAAVILTALAVTLHWHCGNAVITPDIRSQCQTDDNFRWEGGIGPIDGFVLSKLDGKWIRLCFMSHFYGDLSINNVLQNLKVICRETGRRSDDVSIIAKNLFLLDSLRQNYSSPFSTAFLVCDGTESSVNLCQPRGQGVKQWYPMRIDSEKCWFGVACGKDPNFSVSLHPAGTIGAVTEDSIINGNTAIDIVMAEAFGMTGFVCIGARLKNVAAAAKVVCRQNGYRTSVGYRSSLIAANGSRCLMHNVECKGTEKTLQECKHANVWTPSNFNPDHLFGFGTASLPLFVQCSNSTTGPDMYQHFNELVHPDDPQLVFIAHNEFELPIINDITPETCRAACAHMYQDRNFTAVCVESYSITASPSNQSLDDAYYAALDCPFGNETLADCNHGIEERYSSDPDDIHLFHDAWLTVSCVPITGVHQGFPAGSTVYFSRNSVGVGSSGENSTGDDCIEVDIATGLVQVKFKGLKYFLFSSGTTQNERVARMICQHMYPKKSLSKVIWSADESPSLSFQAQINCPEDATSADACSYSFSKIQAHSSLRVSCVYSDELFRLNLTKGFGMSDGAIQLRFGDVAVYMDTTDWTDQTAAVSCRHLGLDFTRARAITKYISVDLSGVWLLRLSCNGSESLVTDCAQSYQFIMPQRLGSLGYSFVGGAVCNGEKFEVKFVEQAMQIRRLANAATPAIQHGAGLMYLCATTLAFQDESAPGQNGLLTLCKNGGFKHTSLAFIVGAEGNPTKNPSSNSAVTRLVCGSKDASIEQCSYEQMMPANLCGYKTWRGAFGIAIIHCDDKPIGGKLRLAGGASPFEGHVEMLHNGTWMAVCDDGFTDFAATLVCHEIFGHGSDGKAVLGSSFAVSNTKYLLDDVRCNPMLHHRLKDCVPKYFQPGRHNCNACEQAGVTCTGVSYIGDPTLTLNIIDGRLILTCSADGDPSPTYQWFVNGSLASVDRRLVIFRSLNSSENVFYVCTVYNTAGESSVEIELESVGCPMQPHISSQVTQSDETAAVTGISVFLGLLSMAVVVLIVYTLLLRRRLAMFESSSSVIPKVAYSNPYVNLEVAQPSAS